jgi:hypothetical protein
MNSIYNPIYKENQSGKIHSMKYEKDDIKFAQWLRLNYYNVLLSNRDVYELRVIYKSDIEDRLIE